MTGLTIGIGSWTCSNDLHLTPSSQLPAVWRFSSLMGWYDGVGVRDAPMVSLSGSDGDVDGAFSLSGRQVVIEGLAHFLSRAEMLAGMDGFSSLLAGGARLLPLVISETDTGLSRQLLVRLGGAKLVEPVTDRILRWSLSLYAADPRRYSSVLRQASTGRFTVGSGGRPSPYTPPYTYDGTGSSPGLLTVRNAGTVDTWPVIRFTGPLSSPSLTMVGGPSVAVLADIPAGTQMVVDTQRQTVMIGDASRSAFLAFTSQFFPLPPGESQLLFEAASGSGAVTVEWRDAWP